MNSRFNQSILGLILLSFLGILEGKTAHFLVDTGEPGKTSGIPEKYVHIEHGRKANEGIKENNSQDGSDNAVKGSKIEKEGEMSGIEGNDYCMCGPYGWGPPPPWPWG